MLFWDHSTKCYHAEYHFANIIESSVAMLILIEQYAVIQTVIMPSVIFQAGPQYTCHFIKIYLLPYSFLLSESASS